METFTQPKITGYRQLNEKEAALMNELKSHGIEAEKLLAKVSAHLQTQTLAIANGTCDPLEPDRFDAAEPRRWVAMARTDLQRGLMAAIRAVAQPTTF